MRGGNFPPTAGVLPFMKPDWIWRQVLAILRGVAIIIVAFWMLVLVQLLPALLRGGVAGVREHITRVAIAGVPPERWDVAVAHMYAVLGAAALFLVALFAAQRYLARKLASHVGSA